MGTSEMEIAVLYLSVAITDSNLCKMERARIKCCCLLASNRVMSTIIENNVLQVSWTHLAYYRQCSHVHDYRSITIQAKYLEHKQNVGFL